MRVAVVGAGAMGSIFGARFAQAGHDTVLVDVATPLVEKINADGVTVVRGDEETTTRVRATNDPRPSARSTSSSSSPSATTLERRPNRHVRSSGRTRSWRRSRTAGGTATCSHRCFRQSRSRWVSPTTAACSREPGLVVHPAEQPTFVGAFVDGNSSGAERLAQALNDASLDDDGRRARPPRDLEEADPQCRHASDRRAHGSHGRQARPHAPTARAGHGHGKGGGGGRQALGYEIDADERVDAIHALLAKAGPSKASMLQDTEAGRRTEVDVINGAVVRAADDLGVPAPLNRALTQMIKGWESPRGLG